MSNLSRSENLRRPLGPRVLVLGLWLFGGGSSLCARDVFVVLSGITALSFIGIAGSFGQLIGRLFGVLFGVIAYLVPLFLLLIATSVTASLNR